MIDHPEPTREPGTRLDLAERLERDAEVAARLHTTGSNRRAADLREAAAVLRSTPEAGSRLEALRAAADRLYDAAWTFRHVADPASVVGELDAAGRAYAPFRAAPHPLARDYAKREPEARVDAEDLKRFRELRAGWLAAAQDQLDPARNRYCSDAEMITRVLDTLEGGKALHVSQHETDGPAPREGGSE